MAKRIPFLESKPWRALRQHALRRDGYRCVRCGVDISAPGAARVDHVLPRKTHPHLALSLANTRSLCASCDNKSHAEKGLPFDKRTGARIERITGSTNTGLPLDPRHHWYAKR